jgi:C-terminal processing protease CtpA/Prc/Tol biopolymer transport system component
MIRKLLLCILAVLSLSALPAMEPDFARDPAISPDGRELCFVYNGDLWVVQYGGGKARRLTDTDATEWGPHWSPDGKHIAFTSNREGAGYPYLIPAAGGEATAVIRESYSVADWFNDSANLLCIRYNPRLGYAFYKLPLNGERPVMLAEIGDSYASLTDDNSAIIFNRRGDPFREAYTGSQAGELWSLDIATKQYTRLTYTDFTERYPACSHHDKAVYYTASDGNCLQLFRVRNMNFDAPEQLSFMDQWSVRDISIARRNDRIVFELFDQLWAYDPSRPKDQRVFRLQIDIPEDHWRESRRLDTMKNDFHNYAISPNELLLGFAYKYDAFFMPRKGGEVKRVTTDQAGIDDLEFIDDISMVVQKRHAGRSKLFVARADSIGSLHELDWFGRDSLEVLSIEKDYDGRWIIRYNEGNMNYQVAIADEGLQDLRAVNPAGPVVSNFAINKAGTYAAYAINRRDYIRELYLYDIAAGTHTKLMNDDTWIQMISWTKDNKSLLLSRSGDIYRLDLVPRNEYELDTDNWEEILAWAHEADEGDEGFNSDNSFMYFTDSDSLADSTAVAQETGETDESDVSVELISDSLGSYEEEELPLEIVWENLDKRLYPVILDEDIQLWPLVVESDSTFYYISNGFMAGLPVTVKRANIYGGNISEEAVLGDTAWNMKLQGDMLYYISQGVIKSYDLDYGKKAEIKAEFTYDYDVDVLNARVFEEAWGVFGQNFYDPAMHGKDWNAIYNLYRPYVDKARDIDIVAWIIEEMIGDLNASHTGFYPRQERSIPSKQTALLGLELDYSTLLPEGIRINIVYPGTRLAHFYKMKSGDIITHIDDVLITPSTSIDSLLTDKIGKKIRLRYTREGLEYSADTNGLAYSAQRRLVYEHKISRSRDLVNLMTDGKIGYIHIPAMGNADYENFTRELYRDNADKKALIIDVRGNVGGRIHDLLLTLLMKRKYAFSTSRRYQYEQSPEPWRVWDRPTIVLVDENSFSDGEIFPIIYKELNLGKVVGMPSSGAVIGTWEYELIDGSSMRMPGSGWYKLDGTNMEGTGAMPDIIVENTPNDIIAGRDPQLLRAIEEILREIE